MFIDYDLMMNDQVYRSQSPHTIKPAQPWTCDLRESGGPRRAARRDGVRTAARVRTGMTRHVPSAQSPSSLPAFARGLFGNAVSISLGGQARDLGNIVALQEAEEESRARKHDGTSTRCHACPELKSEQHGVVVRHSGDKSSLAAQQSYRSND